MFISELVFDHNRVNHTVVSQGESVVEDRGKVAGRHGVLIIRNGFTQARPDVI